MSKLSNHEILQIFRDKFIEFLDCILELFPEDKNILLVRTVFNQGYPVKNAMTILKTNITPLKDTIRRRDDSFFLTNQSASLFSGISSDNVIKWREIWTSERLDQEDKDCIWDWITLFLNLSEKYNN